MTLHARYAIAEMVREEIRNGVYQSGDLLPSQPELARRLGVARETVKRAYELLEAEGLIKARAGAGTYVL